MKLVSATHAFPFFHQCFSPPTSNQHSFSGTSRPTCDVRIKFVKSVCGLIPVPGGCRAKKTSTEGEDASRTSRVVFGNNVVFVSSHVHLSCKTRVLQFGPYATASASAALLQIEFPRLSKSGLFSALVSSSRIVSYSFSNLSSHANLPSWTSCQGSARRPYMKDSASCRPFVGWSLLYSRPDANNSRLWTTRVADVPNATYKASEMVRTRSSSSSSPC